MTEKSASTGLHSGVVVPWNTTGRGITEVSLLHSRSLHHGRICDLHESKTAPSVQFVPMKSWTLLLQRLGLLIRLLLHWQMCLLRVVLRCCMAADEAEELLAGSGAGPRPRAVFAPMAVAAEQRRPALLHRAARAMEARAHAMAWTPIDSCFCGERRR
jgi:hypothetical protein